MSTAGSASSASAKERLIPPTDCTRNGEKTSVDKPVHQKQTHAPRTADLSDFSSAAVWIFEESRPLKISAPQKRMRPPLFPHCFVFALRCTMEAKAWVFPARGISRARGVLRANYAASLFHNAAPALREVSLSRECYGFVEFMACPGAAS